MNLNCRSCRTSIPRKRRGNHKQTNKQRFGGRNNRKKSKPFSDGEFVKECIVRVADFLCPEKKETFAKISLSRQTIARRVEELGYSLALDESTNI